MCTQKQTIDNRLNIWYHQQKNKSLAVAPHIDFFHDSENVDLFKNE